MNNAPLTTVKFTPKTHVEEYLIDQQSISIYEQFEAKVKHIQEMGHYWPVELKDSLNFFNCLYEQLGILEANSNRPLSIIHHLGALELDVFYYSLLIHSLLELTEHKADVLYGCRHFLCTEGKHLNFCCLLRESDYAVIDGTVDGGPEETEYISYREGFVVEEFNDLPDMVSKKMYLIEKIAQVRQLNIGLPEGEFRNNNFIEGGEGNFIKWAEIEIQKYDEILKIESEQSVLINKSILGKSGFKLSGGKGKKIDLIRVLNALYALQFIELENGQLPSKKMFMEKAGEFFGVDLEKYDTDLSQAFKNGKIDSNLKIFDEMKAKTTQIIDEQD